MAMPSVTVVRGTPMLSPLALREWEATDHLVHFTMDAVEHWRCALPGYRNMSVLSDFQLPTNLRSFLSRGLREWNRTDA
jgi:hypothetical protein